ncbi:MAG: DUF4129 domain-containing protein [Chitinophagaceae bacterium]|nr:DUF4129 domain-containing protein [Anaerolineae bacterium]
MRSFPVRIFKRWLAVMVIGILAASITVTAQSAPLPEAEYWVRLQQTNTVLQQSLASGLSDSAITQINALWAGVESFVLPDGQLFSLDVAWLRVDRALTPDDLRTLQIRIQALLDYHAVQTGTTESAESSLAALERVLQDERFRYEQAPSESQPTNSRPFPSGGFSAAAQLILIVIGIGLVIALMVNFARGLRIQRTVLLNDAAPEDDPITSAAALDRAAESQTAQDYRAAIRYLYLSSLLLLDERGVIDYDPSLTNREHLEQVRPRREIFELLSAIVSLFDRVWYGFAPVDEALYQGFRQRVERLQQVTA